MKEQDGLERLARFQEEILKMLENSIDYWIAYGLEHASSRSLSNETKAEAIISVFRGLRGDIMDIIIKERMK